MRSKLPRLALTSLLLSQIYCGDASGPGNDGPPLQIAATTFAGATFVLDQTGTTTATISCGEFCRLYNPQWSFSGQQLAMIGYDAARNSILYVSNADGSSLREIARTASISQVAIKGLIRYLPNYYDQTWSYSGKLAYIKRDTIFQVPNTSNPAPVRVVNGVGEISQLSWLPRDTAISFVSNGILKVANLNGIVRQLGTFAGQVYKYDWAPDGSTVAVVTYGPDSVRLYSLSSKAGSMTLVATHNSISYPCWSENSKSIAYVASNYGDTKARLLVMNASDMSVRQLPDQQVELGSPMWTSNTSLFLGGSNGFALINVTENSSTLIPAPAGVNGYAVSTGHCGKMFYLLPDGL